MRLSRDQADIKKPAGEGGRWSGDEGIRTLDLRIANATLSQLSYVPDKFLL